MKKKFLAAMVALLPLLTLAQGWPAYYGGVMLQGFYWNSYSTTKWSALQGRADELGDLFDLIWVPNSGRTDANGTAENMGYSPRFWLNHNTIFGTETELRNMIEAYRAKGTGIMMDLVINHKSGATGWVDFDQESVVGKVTGKTYSVKWDNEKFSQICKNDECNYSGYKTTGANDTGDNFDGSRDLDHTNITTQENIRVYQDFLQNELGYVGYRLDMTKGYSASYTGKYNNWTKPYFSVGEYWDGNADLLRAWLDGTIWNNQKQSATFDYCLKYRINEAFINNNWSALSDKGLAADVWYNRWAVTFVDNHDTGQTNNSSRMSNSANVAAANAFILAMPGTPCIFISHYENNKTAIANMIKGRRAARVTNMSPITVQEESNGGYILEVQGERGKVYLQLGGATSNGTPSGFQLVQSGTNYKYFVSTGLNWKTSTKQGDGVPCTTVASETPTGSQITIFVKAEDASSAHLYAWDSNNNYIDNPWPGTAVRTLPFTMVAGAKWYYKTFTQSKVNVIFNNGSGGTENNQTADIKNISTSSFFTYSGTDYTKYENVTSTVKPYINYTLPALATALDGHVYCYLETSDYTQPYVYTWDSNGKQYTGDWPGTKMTKVGTAATGKSIWRWDGGTLDSQPDNIIFNNGSTTAGKQTEDLDFANGGYYTLYGMIDALEEELPDPVDMYVLGEVEGNGGWYPNKGLKMTASADYNTFTATVTTKGQNSGYSYFSFTKQLGTSATDWASIDAYRIGADASSDFEVTTALLGTELPLGSDGSQTAFKIKAGTWKLTMKLRERTLVVTDASAVSLPGDVNGDGNIDISDVNLIINTILDLNSSAEQIAKSDVNGDGTADITDLNMVVNMVLK